MKSYATHHPIYCLLNSLEATGVKVSPMLLGQTDLVNSINNLCTSKSNQFSVLIQFDFSGSYSLIFQDLTGITLSLPAFSSISLVTLTVFHSSSSLHTLNFGVFPVSSLRTSLLFLSHSLHGVSIQSHDFKCRFHADNSQICTSSMNLFCEPHICISNCLLSIFIYRLYTFKLGTYFSSWSCLPPPLAVFLQIFPAFISLRAKSHPFNSNLIQFSSIQLNSIQTIQLRLHGVKLRSILISKPDWIDDQFFTIFSILWAHACTCAYKDNLSW